MNPLELVRQTTAWVMAQAQYVTIDDAAIQREAAKMAGAGERPAKWEHDYHYTDGGPLTAQFLFVVDALNFCFWPDPTLEYEPLVRGLKGALDANPHAFDAGRLASMDADTLRQWTGRDLPQMDERVRLLREIGRGLARHFDGKAANLVRVADGSVARLVELVTAHFPGFRDHAIYRGRQIFFYKRAQIFAGDVWGAYGGEGIGVFDDIADLTMFADYRVPQLLRPLSILRYSDELAATIDAREELPAGSEMEIELRAATVQAVERLRGALAEHGRRMHSVEVDWVLWQRGESRREELPPHHRTLTIYY